MSRPTADPWVQHRDRIHRRGYPAYPSRHERSRSEPRRTPAEEGTREHRRDGDVRNTPGWGGLTEAERVAGGAMVREKKVPISTTTGGRWTHLKLRGYFPPNRLREHACFSVLYPMIGGQGQTPLELRVYVGKTPEKGRLLVAGLSFPALQPGIEDVRELACLRFHFSPGGVLDLSADAVHQPAAVWVFGGGRILLACAEGSEEKKIEDWLAQARDGRRDRRLHGIILRNRRAARSWLDEPKGWADWPKVTSEKPLKGLYPFRRDEPETAAAVPRPAGVLAHVAGSGAGATPRRPEPTLEARKRGAARPDLPERSDLHRLGYRLGGLSRQERWRILIEEAVPRLGLEKVVRTIAGHRQRVLSQAGGATRYAHAVAEWEHDLERLKREVYVLHRLRFAWPRYDP